MTDRIAQTVLMLLLLGALSCKETADPDELLNDSTNLPTKPAQITIDTSEIFIIDTLELGYSSIFNKESHVLKLNFYKMNKNNWVFHYSIDSILSQWGENELQFMDFDFDGLKDARLSTGTGARGANECYEVFLKKEESKKFTRLKCDDLPPNLTPNPKTRKVEAIRFYGKTRFEEHTIKEDSLIILKGIEVWSIGDWTYRNYEFYNLKGEKTNSRLDSIQDYGESSFSAEPLK